MSDRDQPQHTIEQTEPVQKQYAETLAQADADTANDQGEAARLAQQYAETMPPSEPASYPGTLLQTPEEMSATRLQATIASQQHLPHVPGFEILSELGRGGMGIVYKARQIKVNRLVALKMILNSKLSSVQDKIRFQIEAEAVAHLQHPNIVLLHEVGEHEGVPYFSLEFCDGGSLDHKLLTWLPKPDEAAALVEKLARAMHHAHLRGVVHRDLKPANVLLASDGTPKITDFGLAKKLDSGSNLSRSGAIMGTPSYMAPEQAEGKVHDTGPAADVYALGALLYELLTGKPPFIGESAIDTIHKVVNDEPASPSTIKPGLPKDLETICLRCLEKDPKKRYGSADELADDLRRHLDGEAVHARPLGKSEQVWRWCRRNPVPASLVLTAIAGSIFGMWYLSRLSQEIVRTTALENASQQAEMFEQLNSFYSNEVILRPNANLMTSYEFREHPGTIPLPATLTIELGQYISNNSQNGLEVRVYSDYPFMNRMAHNEGGPRDEFESKALEFLRDHPNEPYTQFETRGGRPTLRYAKARIMKQSCVECHNTHELSQKKDWKVGDVRGALEIIRPLDVDVQKARSGLRSTYILIGGFCAFMLAFSLMVLMLSKRKRR
ncbi:hypothetical protein BH11PLA2_BH11PLA2_12390 [soil metagenome]